MNSTLKLALVVGALASTALACSAAPADVTADVNEGDVDPTCVKGGITCGVTGTGGVTGGTKGGTYGDLGDLEPTIPTVGGTTGGKGNFGGLVGGFGDWELEPPRQGDTFLCAGAGPEGGEASYQVVRVESSPHKECWSVVPLLLANGTPWGFTALSRYYCPADFPVQRCNAYQYCTCWSS